jgi:hypothetical protein
MKLLAAISVVLLSGSFGCAGAALRLPHVPAPVSIDSGRPLTIRAEAGFLWASPHAWSEPRRAWKMPARGPVEGLALAQVPGEGGYVVTFRQGGVVWRGELDADRAARGPLEVVTPMRSASPESSRDLAMSHDRP